MVKRLRGEPGHTGHTGHTGTDGHTDHTDEPHNHRNPTTHPHDDATAEAAAESRAARTAAGPEPTAPRGRLRACLSVLYRFLSVPAPPESFDISHCPKTKTPTVSCVKSCVFLHSVSSHVELRDSVGIPVPLVPHRTTVSYFQLVYLFAFVEHVSAA